MQTTSPKVLKCINAWIELQKVIADEVRCNCFDCKSYAAGLKREKLAMLTADLSKKEFRELQRRLCY